ncbi:MULTISPECIES: YqgE/AlgH family protein [unclassified Undibacterium]|uniref:YqgE/AlgH family protein n=1 Tax=unclassified Undibacterium TaxID=2630295 RepID=UPI002AC8E400|nr:MULTISPECIES: YqgE/AlgH family protein [unclassified Undibacterium]MEB0137906.1 YqgE/AlgH family protein [Undibacterium sp. CCC2.1]MEB0172026.1 YqgE/AlgH family protein [Undibacterium sp. CCC1.1]MEB0174914.1 YqgE/AlgH family protein [Undibacterium sp. CCC3.4]MEB0214878.1 YqgE/AlgH family protein [Undibacterium sp. 5I2]WPX45633.1 YqgE/AlgH family protein [Undibacterium sp. CCC3.4]
MAAAERAGDSIDSTLITTELNLTNHFLISMPAMHDPVFGGSVIYLCEHTPRGAMGMVVNRATDMTVADLFERIELKLENIPDSHPMRAHLVLFGGPVQDDRGFVLHSPVGEYSSSLKVTDDIAFTTSRDVLEAIAAGDGPEQVLMSVGYAGWGAGQLEQEILSNQWLTVAADTEVLFSLSLEQRLHAAIKLLGIDPLMLAAVAGHA